MGEGEITSALVWGLLGLLFVSSTSFIKLSVVFTALRSALGLNAVPSSAIIATLSVALSLLVMAPVGEAMWDATVQGEPGVETVGPINLDLIERGIRPLRAFLDLNSGEREQALFSRLATERGARHIRADGLLLLVPAFMITELAEAFQIGFLVLLPFLVVDLVVANIVASLGLQSLRSETISMPFKLLLFVLVDGWYILSEALLLGYA